MPKPAAAATIATAAETDGKFLFGECMSNEPDKIIYSMIRVSKRHGQKEVLKDISLSYFYGAKIGVLGLNGAGKSSLLKILAGVDSAFDGKTVLAPGYTIGYLEQEPLAGETRNAAFWMARGASDERRRVCRLIRAGCFGPVKWPSYPESICRAQFRCGLKDASTGQLYNILNTIRNRAAAFRRRSKQLTLGI